MCSLLVLSIPLFFTTGAAEKPYTVEDAVSYNELDYLSVSLFKPFHFVVVVVQVSLYVNCVGCFYHAGYIPAIVKSCDPHRVN